VKKTTDMRILVREANPASGRVDCSAEPANETTVQSTNVSSSYEGVLLTSTGYANVCRILRSAFFPCRKSIHCERVLRHVMWRTGTRLRTTRALRTKIVRSGLKSIGPVGIPTDNTRLTPGSCVTDVGNLVPATWNHPSILSLHGLALANSETRILVPVSRYRGARVSALRNASIVAAREEHDSGDKKQRLHHRSTNLSDTIVAKRSWQCKSCRDRLATG
jgi:hypothetical protein